MAVDRGLVVRISADLAALRKELANADASIKPVVTSISKLASEFKGDKVVGEVNRMVIAIERVGGASGLSATQQERVNKKVQEAIGIYDRLGKDVPPEWRKIEEATRRAQQETSALGGFIQRIGPMVAATFSVGAITGFLRSIIGTADGVKKLANQASMTNEEIQRLEALAIGSGSSLQSLVGAAQNLQQRIGSGDEGLEGAVRRLNLNLGSIEQMGAYEQLQTLGAALSGVQDPATRAALAADIFGKSWKEILPAIVSGMNDVESAVFTMSNGTIDRLDAMGDKWDEFLRKTKAVAGEVVGTIPAVTDDFVGFLRRLVDTGSVTLAAGGTAMADSLAREFKAGLAKALPTVSFKEITTSTGLKVWVMETGKAIDQLAASFGSAGRAAKPLELGTKELERVTRELTDNALRGAESGFKAEADAADKARSATEKLAVQQAANFEDLMNVADAFPEKLRRIRDEYSTTGRAADAFAVQAAAAFEPLMNVTDGFPEKLRRVKTALGQAGRDITAKLADAVKGIPDLLAQAFTGGGGLLGAAKALGVQVGSALISGFASQMMTGLKGIFTGAAGSVSTFLSGLGPLAALGGIFAGVTSMFQSSQRHAAIAAENARLLAEQTAKYAADLKEAQASYADLAAKTKAVTPPDLTYLHEYQEAIPILESIVDLEGQIGDKQKELAALEASLITPWDELQGIVQKYDGDVAALGETFRQMKTSADTTSILNDFEKLTRAGADAGATVNLLSPAIRGVVNDSLKMGTAVPANMKPLIEEMIRAGSLTDEAGVKITDIGKIKFGEPVKTEGDKVKEAMALIKTAIEEMTTKLGEFVDKLKRVPENTEPERREFYRRWEREPWRDWEMPEVPGRPEEAGGGGSGRPGGTTGGRRPEFAGAFFSALRPAGGTVVLNVTVQGDVSVDRRKIGELVFPQVARLARLHGLSG